LTAERLARIVLNEIVRTPRLGECTPASLGGAIMTCAQLGLEPGAATGEAYLLPFRNRRKVSGRWVEHMEVTLIIGYQGMVKLYWQSQLARSLDAQAVYENDDFDYAYGLEPRLEHRPRLGGERGRAVAYYAVATFSTGGSAFVVMGPEDIERIRARSKARDDGPWQTDYDAMAKKTCLRQLFKMLPKSTQLARALAQDEGVRTDESVDAIDVMPEPAGDEEWRGSKTGEPPPHLDPQPGDLIVDKDTGEVTVAGEEPPSAAREELEHLADKMEHREPQPDEEPDEETLRQIEAESAAEPPDDEPQTELFGGPGT
jgi:recombination protein RecT